MGEHVLITYQRNNTSSAQNPGPMAARIEYAATIADQSHGTGYANDAGFAGWRGHTGWRGSAAALPKIAQR